VHEENTIGTNDAVASAVINPASTAFADDAPGEAKKIIVMIRPPIRRLEVTTAANVTSTTLACHAKKVLRCRLFIPLESICLT
jgi:hypothetical protein